jgi:enoyl-CoA hydratase/carnithine racemase
MEYAFLTGRVSPESLEAALACDLIFAAPGTVLVLREGESAAPASVLARRGVSHLPYRLAISPEVLAESAFEEGWIDGIASREEIETAFADPPLSSSARFAASRRASFPSRAASLALERAEFALLNALPDKREGIDAFFEKRRARFPAR